MKQFFRKCMIYLIMTTIAIPSSLVMGMMTVSKAEAANSTAALTTFVDNSVNGTVGSFAWTNPANAKTSDNTYAGTTLSSSGSRTHYLEATGINPTIPTNTTVTGIVAKIERHQSCTSGSCTSVVTDDTVRLVKSGTVVGNNKADAATAWGTSDTTVTYGGTTDLWGTTWTPAEINNASTGVVLSATRGSGGSRDLFVDTISMIVYYTEAPVITINPYNTSLTNQDIIVTASTSDGTLNTTSHTFTQNGSFTFTATGSTGLITNGTVTISNIDKTAPTASVVVGVPALTNQNWPSITVNVENGAAFAIKNGDTILVSGTGLGQNQSVGLGQLADGTYNLTLVASDLALNMTNVNLNQFTIDTLPPTNPSIEINSGAGYTNSANVNLALGADSAVKMSFGAGANWEDFATSKVYPLSGVDGAKTVSVIFQDAAGNSSTTPVSAGITLDTISPLISGVSDAGLYNSAKTIHFSDANLGGALLNGSPISNGYIVDGDGNYSLTVSDLAGNSSTVSFKIDETAPSIPTVDAVVSPINADSEIITGNAEIGSVVTICDGVHNYSVIIGLDGKFSISVNLTQNVTNNFIVTATDQVGNISNHAAFAITEDSISPLQPVLNSIVSPINADFETVSGTSEVGSIVKISDGVAEYSAAAGNDGKFSFSIVLTQNIANNFQITATDQAGNVSVALPFVITEDSIKPVISISRDPDQDLASAIYTVTITWSSDTLSKTYILDSDNLTNYVGPFQVSGDGLHKVTAIGTDGAGNTNSAETSFKIDTTAPTVGDLTAVTAAVPTKISLIVADANAPLTYLTTYSGPGTLTIDPNGWDFTFSANVNGVYSIGFTVTDPAGNHTTKYLSFTWNAAANVISDGQSVVLPAGARGGAEIALTPGAQNTNLDLSAFKEEDGAFAIPLSVTVTGQVGGTNFATEIDPGTRITGPEGWNGIVNLPNLQTVDSSLLPANTNDIPTSTLALEIGLGSQSLTFSKPVKLTFAGRAGQRIGFLRDGAFVEITDTCVFNQQDIESDSPILAAGAACKINAADNKDLIVWTTHFTTFVAYGEGNVPAPVFTASKNVQSDANYAHLVWNGNGSDQYLVKIDGALVDTITTGGSDLSVVYTRNYKVTENRAYTVTVLAKKLNVLSINNSTQILDFTLATTATTTSTSVEETTATVTPTTAKAATNPEPATVETPKDDGSAGITKGAETTAADTSDSKNWTPWIILFILIVLAGAATGGYFYWFAGKDDDEEDKKEKEAKKIEPKVEVAAPAPVTVTKKRKKSKRW
ncbi:MAG: Ig-like domain-containing protein [Candidatus Berkelbacteria bacterium]|nr:Ig-like domain-containing protein [Candidatus Berkelbacteria bacterium]